MFLYRIKAGCEVSLFFSYIIDIQVITWICLNINEESEKVINRLIKAV